MSGCAGRRGTGRGAARELGVAHARRDRSHAVATAREPPTPARVDQRLADESRQDHGAAPFRLDPAQLDLRRVRGRDHTRPAVAARGRASAAAALPVVAGPVDCAAHEHAGAHGPQPSPAAGAGGAPARDRRAHLGLLHRARGCRPQRAAAGQPPGNAATRRRRAHLADQLRPVPARHHHGARLRLDRRSGDGRATRADARHLRAHGAPSRAFPQLVRDAHAASAAAALPVDGGQRQPGRAPARGCAGLSRTAFLPAAGPERASGIEDALELTRESLRALPAGHETPTHTRGQLHEALDALGRALVELPFADLAPFAATIADIAQALAEERGDAPGDELHYWPTRPRAIADTRDPRCAARRLRAAPAHRARARRLSR